MDSQLDNPSLGSLSVSIDEEMERSYLLYSMSVIVGRALPDVRDGLKPVHRRTVYAMNDAGLDPSKPYRKCARIVGDVMSKYHPHGDTAVYDALVRMGQEFSLLHPLVDGQGNFGSIDGDAPAAMRYTEARLAKISSHLFKDIKKDTVDFVDNYDGSEREPKVLPVAFPNILVNGSCGVAVGMATNIPPHNLAESIDACIAYIANEDITIAELGQIVVAPDFPTGGQIVGIAGFRSAIETGRGIIRLRGVSNIEKLPSGKHAIIITEIPYQVNKAKMVERIAEMVREKRIEGISDLRDESDKSGIRVVVEVKRDMTPEVVLNQLYSHTSLQVSYGINLLALDNGYPRQMSLKDIVRTFVQFRRTVVARRTNYELRRARDRVNMLTGLYIAILNIDKIVEIIRGAANPEDATNSLLLREWAVDDSITKLVFEVENLLKVEHSSVFKLNIEQVKAILDLKLQRLTRLEKDTLYVELTTLMGHIREYLEILSSRERIDSIIISELTEIRDRFRQPRRTTVIEDALSQMDDDSLINREDIVVTVTMRGYIKRTSLAMYKAQSRGGKGRSGANVHDDDAVIQIFMASTHSRVLFFSSLGRVYQLKGYNLPSADVSARGKPIVNFLNLSDGETITSVCPVSEEDDGEEGISLVFATASGHVRRNNLGDFANIKSNGKIAIRLEEGDALVGVTPCDADQDILLATRSGKCIRFPVDALRVFKGRDSDGVRGIKLSAEDKVISLSLLSAGSDISNEERAERSRLANKVRRNHEELEGKNIEEIVSQEQFLLTVTENGFGKRTSSYEYRVTNRGGSGIVNIVTSTRNGPVISSMVVGDRDHMMLITDKGQIIRVPVTDVRVIGRNTQGVSIFKVATGERIISAARILASDKVDDDTDAEPQQ